MTPAQLGGLFLTPAQLARRPIPQTPRPLRHIALLQHASLFEPLDDILERGYEPEPDDDEIEAMQDLEDEAFQVRLRPHVQIRGRPLERKLKLD